MTSEILKLIYKGEFGEAKKQINGLSLETQQLWYKCKLEGIKGNYSKKLKIAQSIFDQDLSLELKIRALLCEIEARFRIGDYNKADKLIKNVKQLFNCKSEIDNQEILRSELLNYQGNVLIEQGNLTQGLNLFQQSLELRERLGNPILIAFSHNNIAFTREKMGELKIAFDYYNKALVILEKEQLKISIPRVKSNIAEIHRIRGNIDKSLELHLEALNVRKQLNNKYDMAMSYRYVGVCYFNLDKIDLAKKYIEKSITIWNEIGNKLWKSSALLDYGKLLLHQHESVLEVLNQLERLNNLSDNLIIQQRYLLMKALYLKSRNRMIEIAEAQQIFERIINQETVDFEITFESLIRYCELLLFELRISDEPEIFEEAKSVLNRVQRLANVNHAYGKIIEILLLKSKMAIIEFNYKKAKALLLQAELLAEEQNMPGYLDLINSAKIEVSEDMVKLTELIRKNHNLIERIHLVGLTDYLSKAYDISKKVKNNLNQ